MEPERLERALGELAFAVRTLQRVMVERGRCSHEESAAKLRQVDLDDGRPDGRLSLP